MPTLEQLQKEIKEIKKELKQLKQRLDEDELSPSEIAAIHEYERDKKAGKKFITHEELKKQLGL